MYENTHTVGEAVTSPSHRTRPGARTDTPPRVRRNGALRTLISVIGAVLLVTALAAAAWVLARSTDAQTHAFGFSVDQIVVEGINGGVTFEAGESGEVTVEREWILSGPPEVEIMESEGVLRITGDCGSLCRIHVAGTAPADTGLVVQTDAGSVAIAGLNAGLDLTTSAGNLTVTDVGGPVRLRTDAGSIRGGIADGDVDAQTSAGGIDLEVRGKFSRVSAMTDAGSIRLSVPHDVYRVEAETSVGATRVDVPTDPDAARVIVARSGAGNVTIERLP